MTPFMLKERSMRKQAPMIEWMIAENDADWERCRILRLPDSEPAARLRQPLKRYFWGVAACSCCWWASVTGGGARPRAGRSRPQQK
jgi:hypothetical protein